MSNVRLRWKRIGRNPSCGFETGIIEAMAAEVAACGVRWRALSVGGIYRLDPSNQKPVARHIWQCGKLIFKKGRSGGEGRGSKGVMNSDLPAWGLFTRVFTSEIIQARDVFATIVNLSHKRNANLLSTNPPPPPSPPPNLFPFLSI